MAASSNTAFGPAEFGLEELVHAASKTLRRLGLDWSDERVSSEIDARTVRYYQSLGLVDPPLRRDGRHAVYGQRHLLQLACIKKLQADGHPLSLIQPAVAGRSNAELELALETVAAYLGRGSSKAAAAASPSPASSSAVSAGPRALVASEIAPGVTVLVDPALVPRADALVERLSAVARASLSA